MQTSTPSQPLVSILILNYNGKKFLDDCFASVLASTYANVEVVMVDNQSTDDSVAYVKANHPNIKVFETGANAGFSLAYNKAFKQAQGKYFVVLNNDVTVEPGWLEPLVAELEANPDVAAVQPKMLSMLDHSNFEYAGAAGGFMDKYGFPFLRGRVFTTMEKDTGQYDTDTDLVWTSGAAMVVRASVVPQTGGMDNHFVHHMEEIDWCYRMLLLGYRLRFVHASLIYHYGGATITPDSYRKIYWNHRNSTFMLLKNVESRNLWLIVATKILLDLMAVAWALTRGEFVRIKAIFNGFGWLIKNRKLIKQKRQQVQQTRTITDAQLWKQFYPKSIAIQYFFKNRKTYASLMEALKK